MEKWVYCGGHPIGPCGNKFTVPAGKMISTTQISGWPNGDNPFCQPRIVRAAGQGEELWACSLACEETFATRLVDIDTNLVRVDPGLELRQCLDGPSRDHRFKTAIHNGLNWRGSECLLAASDVHGTLPIIEGVQMHQDNVRYLQHTGSYVSGDNNQTAEHIAACFKPGLYEDIYNAQNCHGDELDGLIAAQHAVAAKRHEQRTTVTTLNETRQHTCSQDSTALESPAAKCNRSRAAEEVGDFKGDQRDLEIGDFNFELPHLFTVQDGGLPLVEQKHPDPEVPVDGSEDEDGNRLDEDGNRLDGDGNRLGEYGLIMHDY